MTSVLDALAGRLAARKTTATETLVAAARRLAAGEGVDDGGIEAAMLETGMTLDGFRSMVELCQRRRGWQATAAKATAAGSRLDKATAALERATADFEATRQAFVVRHAELSSEVAAVERAVAEARQASANLVAPDNVPGPLGDQLREAHDQVAAANQALEALERDRREWAERERYHRGWADTKRQLNQTTPAGSAADHERAAARAARRVAEIDGQLPAARKAVAAAEKSLEGLERAAAKA